MKEKINKNIAVIVVALMVIVGGAIAANATTIGTNYTSAGTMVLTGTVATGLTLSGTNSTAAITASGTQATVLNVQDVADTDGHVIDMIDAYLGKVIETGTYQSTASGGVTLTSTNARPVSFLFDDAGTTLSGDVRAVLSRVLLTVDQTGGTTNALRGQIKILDDKDITGASVVAPITGYFEMTGTANRTLTGHVAGVRAALEEGASGTTTIAASSYYAGFEATLNSTRSYTTTGEMAGLIINISGGTSVWDKGIMIDDSSATTGIDVGIATTGLLLSGATTDAIKIDADATTGINLTSNVSATDGILLAGANADAIHISGANTANGINISGANVDGIEISGANTAIALNISGASVTGIDLGDSLTTTGIDIGTAPTGLTFSGGYTTAAIQLGTSGSNMTLAAAGDYAIDINTTSASTDTGTSVQPVHMISTMTGVGGVGGRALFEMDTEVVLGGWANALKGYTDFGTAGSVTGLGSAVVAEMRLPAKTLTGGTYAPLEIELVVQASGTTGGTPVSFIYAEASGDATALTDFNTTGYIFDFAGLTDTADGVFDASSVDDIDATHVLRIRIGGTPYYIPLNTAITLDD